MNEKQIIENKTQLRVKLLNKKKIMPRLTEVIEETSEIDIINIRSCEYYEFIKVEIIEHVKITKQLHLKLSQKRY